MDLNRLKIVKIGNDYNIYPSVIKNKIGYLVRQSAISDNSLILFPNLKKYGRGCYNFTQGDHNKLKNIFPENHIWVNNKHFKILNKKELLK